jgi:hypothetical protein
MDEISCPRIPLLIPRHLGALSGMGDGEIVTWPSGKYFAASGLLPS